MAFTVAHNQASMRARGLVTEWIAEGQLNRLCGWLTLLIGVGLASWLDPWLLSTSNAAATDVEGISVWRHAQGVIIAMGLLQLAMSRLLSIRCFPTGTQVAAGSLTTAGAICYCGGYALGTAWPNFQQMILAGSLANLLGFALLWRSGPTGPHAATIRIVLPVACFGMILDFTTGILQLMPPLVVTQFFGGANEVPLRMLRLARVAAIALPVLTLLYYGLVTRQGDVTTRPASIIRSWGGRSLAAGAVGMPALLTLAGCTSLHLKYLLPLPAAAVTVGVMIAVLIAWQRGPGLERFGWVLVLASLSAGLTMGLFAFDGPFPAPAFLGEYNNGARRLVRLAHSYAIVFGMLSIFLARTATMRWRRLRRFGEATFRTGCLATLVAMCLSVALREQSWLLACGPVLIVAGCLACLAASAQDRQQQPSLRRQP